jgi:hypothetical protein
MNSSGGGRTLGVGAPGSWDELMNTIVKRLRSRVTTIARQRRRRFPDDRPQDRLRLAVRLTAAYAGEEPERQADLGDRGNRPGSRPGLDPWRPVRRRR